MDHYKIVVMDYLQSDRAVFLNRECCLKVDEAAPTEKAKFLCSCDAVAVDLRHGAVYLCDTSMDVQLHSLVKKLSAWTRNWDAIKDTPGETGRCRPTGGSTSGSSCRENRSRPWKRSWNSFVTPSAHDSR